MSIKNQTTFKMTDIGEIPEEYNYPPDKQELATQTVLEQATLLCAEWGGVDQARSIV